MSATNIAPVEAEARSSAVGVSKALTSARNRNVSSHVHEEILPLVPANPE